MRKFITLFFVGMFLNVSLGQTNTFTVYYFDAKPGTEAALANVYDCLLYTSPSPRDATLSRMPSSA